MARLAASLDLRSCSTVAPITRAGCIPNAPYTASVRLLSRIVFVAMRKLIILSDWQSVFARPDGDRFTQATRGGAIPADR